VRYALKGRPVEQGMPNRGAHAQSPGGSPASDNPPPPVPDP
jgi:hypothetical protein